MTTTEGHVVDRPVAVFRGPDDAMLFMTNVIGVERDKHLRRACADRRFMSGSATRCDGPEPNARYVRRVLGHAQRPV